MWAYTCNDDHDDFIYQYAYAEASSREKLPELPFPAKRYIEGTWNLIDGVPKTAGPSATVVSVTSPAAVDQPIVVRASAPAGTICELLVFPQDAAITPLTPMNVGKDRTAQWSFKVRPELAGYEISFELRCIQRRGSSQMANSTRGGVRIVGHEPQVSNP